MPSSEKDLEARWVRFFAAFDREEFSAGDFQDGTPEAINEITWGKAIRNSSDIGIYYFLNGRKEVLYIGSATVAFGARFWDHYAKISSEDAQFKGWKAASSFRPKVLKKVAEAKEKENKKRYVRALESYLIATLAPPLNQKV